jgi:hypothetical protein
MIGLHAVVDYANDDRGAAASSRPCSLYPKPIESSAESAFLGPGHRHEFLPLPGQGD